MLTISSLYDHSRRKVGYEQGYIPLQLLGEASSSEIEVVAHELTTNRRDHMQRSLSQLFVDTLSVAHEYYVPLGKAYTQQKLPDGIQECIDTATIEPSGKNMGEQLEEQIRAIYARIAYYNGWAKPTSDKDLAHLIVDAHKTIFAIAKEKEVDLVKGIPSFLNSSSDHRALTQFRRSYCPVTTPVIDAFRRIKDNTVCIYAKNSNAWGALPPPTNEEIAKHGLSPFLQANHATFSTLSRATVHESVDSFLMMLPNEQGSSIERLAETVDKVLSFYAASDPRGRNCINRIGDAKWRYEFCGMNYFVQSFGSVYSADNTRYAYGTEQTFIQFVSEAAFHRAVPRDKWQKARETIREKAKDTGQEYDVHGHDADTFVHNIRAGMPPVKWHKDDPSPR